MDDEIAAEIANGVSRIADLAETLNRLLSLCEPMIREMVAASEAKLRAQLAAKRKAPPA
jgi:hypothetical protein